MVKSKRGRPRNPAIDRRGILGILLRYSRESRMSVCAVESTNILEYTGDCMKGIRLNDVILRPTSLRHAIMDAKLPRDMAALGISEVDIKGMAVVVPDGVGGTFNAYVLKYRSTLLVYHHTKGYYTIGAFGDRRVGDLSFRAITTRKGNSDEIITSNVADGAVETTRNILLALWALSNGKVPVRPGLPQGLSSLRKKNKGSNNKSPITNITRRTHTRRTHLRRACIKCGVVVDSTSSMSTASYTLVDTCKKWRDKGNVPTRWK